MVKLNIPILFWNIENITKKTYLNSHNDIDTQQYGDGYRKFHRRGHKVKQISQ